MIDKLRKYIRLRHLLLTIFTFCLADSFAQNYILPDGEYMDTTAIDTTCKSYNLYYYQVGAKYPKSSITLLKEVQGFLQEKNEIYKGSGYITFRFKIDCEGNKMKRTQVLQTDENYKSYHFDKELVNELYLFLDKLNEWKIATDILTNPFSYNTFVTFKIKNGKVVDIIP